MASLTAHLLETSDHGRLGFHSSCPVCRRDRLFGALSSEPVISRRAQAALASGVLALSATAPSAAFATEPDSQQEGGPAPEHPIPGESDTPGFDPGGDSPLPVESPSPSGPPADGGAPDPHDSGPLESEPAEDPDAPIVPAPGPEAPTTPDPGDTGGPALDPVPPPGGSTPSVVPAPPAGSEAPAADAPAERNAREQDRPPRSDNGGASQPRQIDAPGLSDRTAEAYVAPRSHLGGGPSPATAPTIVGVAQVRDQPTSSARKGDPKGGADFLVVKPGDSLWSIARQLLGSDASPAQIAREVTRLWTLNQDRIGTGDPDLLEVGTKLRVR